MFQDSVIRDEQFSEVVEVHPDAKKRVPLGKLIAGATAYKVYTNSFGQILLDPQVSIPTHEAWIFRNPEHQASLRRGLEDAVEGRLMDRGSFASFVEKEK